ncbi:MAG: ABC transporter ATP-binding protein, partial [Acidimicrobiia bacterium]|nr:ABC transporter ATP-binding protein [Acidimicrobiia bacterium]
MGATGVVAAGIDKRFGAVEVLQSVDLDVDPGSVVALLGPSGCGKTTLLRIVAGLERPDAGEVRIGERLVCGAGTWVPPEKRRVGMVFQDWALFPHMTVERNVGYGIGRREPDRQARIDAALDMVGLLGLGDRLPGTLSGGQQQRVALARALAPRPAVLLLDEPFSNLDTTLRVAVRAEVHALLTDLGITSVFVTHDQDEAFVLGDEVAVMRAGRIVQAAPPADVYARPATPWVATFVGDANLVDGTASGDEAGTSLGRIALAQPAQGPVRVLVRPESVRLVADAAGTATVERTEYYGHDSLYVLRTDGGAELRARAGAAPVVVRGDRVRIDYAGPATVAFPTA